MTDQLRPIVAVLPGVTLEPYEAFRHAENLLDAKRPREAVKVLSPVTKTEPGNAAVWELLGRAHFSAAHLEAAEKAFRRLIELEPTSAWAHTALARSLDRQSRHDEGTKYHRLAAFMG